MTKAKRTKGLVCLIGLGLLSAFLASLSIPFPKERLDPNPVISLSIVDCHGVLLREILSDEGGRCRWVTLKKISPPCLQATLAAEDKHFFVHPGIDFLAAVRAAAQNIRHGRIVSGASTIPQQLVRNITHHRRSLINKILEAWLALRLDRTLSKEDILMQYLNRICYGNQTYGIEAAARLYFDKPARDLSLAEAAFLAGLPRSPKALNPYRSFGKAKRRQQQILGRMLDLGFIDFTQMQRAVEEPLNIIKEKIKFRAPHFCDFILSQVPPHERRALSLIQTTLDYSLQDHVEILVQCHLSRLADRGITNAAVIVIDNPTGDILAMVGSKDFFDERNDGQVNGALSPRQPGSTLKPFTYGLGLERGMTAAEVLEDREIQLPTPDGSYRPRNYDQRFHGPVRLRQALACSYNVPAVSLLQALGPDLLFHRLRLLGFISLNKSPSHYGVGLTLGNGEVTLMELVNAYAALSRGGVYKQERSIIRLLDTEKNDVAVPEEGMARRMFSTQVSYILTHILSDKDARVPAFGYFSPLNLPFDCASKTGTTREFKDNWTVGFTPRFTVGVWVGNFDGTPMHNVSGITGCGPLFKDIMLLLGEKKSLEAFPKADGFIKKAICPVSGMLASADCPGAMEDLFIAGTEPQTLCQLHSNHRPSIIIQPEAPPPFGREGRDRFKILQPVNGDIFKIDPVLRPEFQTLKLEACVPPKTGIAAVEWRVNGHTLGESSSPFFFLWHLKPGYYTIEAFGTAGGKIFKTPPVKIQVLS